MSVKTPWAILFCRFQDATRTHLPIKAFHDLFTISGRGRQNIVDYFHDNSHGHLDLDNNTLFGWIDLPMRSVDYTGSGANFQGRVDFVSRVRQAARAAGVPLQDYYNVYISTDPAVDTYGLTTGVVMTLRGSDTSPTIIAHEMGHGFGLAHSRAEGVAGDYADQHDIMSAWSGPLGPVHTFRHPSIQPAGPGQSVAGPALSAANMLAKGWFDLPRLLEIEDCGFRDRIVLRPHLRTDLPGWLAVRIARRYIIEFRVDEGWDAGIPQACVRVLTIEGGASRVASPAPGSYTLLAGAAFAPDRTSTYPHLIRVAVASIDAAAREARIDVSLDCVDPPRPDLPPLPFPTPVLPHDVPLRWPRVEPSWPTPYPWELANLQAGCDEVIAAADTADDVVRRARERMAWQRVRDAADAALAKLDASCTPPEPRKREQE